MKKIRIPLILAVTAVFLFLSGCDAILEAFYPEFATDKGNVNIISIRAKFDLYPSEITGSSQYIAGRVIETNSDTIVAELGVQPLWQWIEEKDLIYWHIEGNLDFYGVEDGEYEVLVWFEQDGDGIPSNGLDEPSERARNDSDGTTIFAFPDVNAVGGWLYGEASLPLY